MLIWAAVFRVVRRRRPVRQVNLGERIATLREEQALTQVELADKARISPSTLSLIESGKVDRPHVTTIRKISRALGVEPQELRRSQEVAGSKTEAPLWSIPGVRERLEELGARWGVATREEFLDYVRNVDPDIDESGNPNGIIAAQKKLAEEADEVLRALREPKIRASIVELLPIEDANLSRLDLAREDMRELRQLRKELRRLYNARIVAIVNYANALAAAEEAEGRTPGYFVPGTMAREQAIEQALKRLEQALLMERTT
jgi:transcriptional regulator with XRE-family HTH domain